MTDLIVRAERPRAITWLACAVDTHPGISRADAEYVARSRVMDVFIADMALQGWRYTGRPMRLRGPQSFVTNNTGTLPRKPSPRTYRRGEPHARTDALEHPSRHVATVPQLSHATAWRWKLYGQFYRDALPTEFLDTTKEHGWL